MKPRPGALILLFGLTAAQEKLVRTAGLKWGLRCRVVPITQYNRTLEQLIANRPSELPEYEGPAPAGQAILLSGIPGALLQTFLQQLQRSHLPHSVLKAVLTEHNRQWTVLTLLEELGRERDAIANGDAPAHEDTP